jgi:hypothetical protein
MDVGKIEATLTAKFDSTPFDRFDKAFSKADRDSKNKIVAKLDGKLDSSGFNRFDKEYGQAKRDAAKGITTHLKADADTRGFRQYRDAQGRLREENGRFAKSNADVQSSTRKTGAGFSALAGNAKMLGGAAAIGGLAIAFRSMVEEQSEAQAVNAQVDAALKSMGGAANISAKQIDELSTSLSKKSGVDDETIKSGAALMLTFGKVRNEAGKGNDIFTQSIGLSGDLSRAFGKDLHGSSIMLGKALNDPIKGITALGRVGVQFTEQQKDQIKTMVESGDTMGAQKLILANLEKQVGGSAEAYGKTLPGAIDRAKVSFGNLMENLGGKVAPAVSGIADVLGGLFEGKKLKGGVGGFLNPIIDGVKAAWPPIKAAFKEISKAFGDVFGSGKDAKKFGADMQTWGRALGAVIKFAANAFKDAAPTIRFILKYLLIGIREFTELQVKFGRDVVKMANWIGNAWNNVSRWVSNAVKNVTSFLRGAVSTVSSAAKSIGRGIVNGFDAVASIPGKVGNWIGNVVSGVRGLAGKALSAGKSVGSAIINGIGDGLSGLGSFLANVGRGIANWINANTPFGDSIKVGPVSVRLPALAQGGRVGPSTGGARVFIAGEGGADEWVISQEGDRKKNLGWAMEAVSALGGQIPMFAAGTGAKKIKKISPLTGKMESHTPAQWRRIEARAGSLVRGAAPLGSADPNTAAEYALEVAKFDGADDGTIGAAITGWRGLNLQGLGGALLGQLGVAWSKYGAANGRLAHWRSELKLKGNSKGYARRRTIAAQKLAEAVQTATDDRSAAGGIYSQLAELLKPADASDGDDSSGGGDTTAPSIEQRVAAELQSFIGARRSAISSFSSNFSPADVGFASMSPGVAMSGAGSSGALAASGAQVRIVNNYQAPPEDPHSWSAGLAYELKAAL